MPFNTRNPIPSGYLRDLDDNARNIDTWANDKTKLSHPDRFGVQRWTWHGIEQEAKLNIQKAIDAKNAAQEAAMMSGFSKYADTLAQLEAGIGTDYVDGDVVLVFQDEARGGTFSIYKVESGVPVFKNAFDKTRQDLLSFTGTISADAEWSDVPAHSDPAFDLQAQALANRTEMLMNGVGGYSKIREYAGNGTRLKVQDPTGVHWWVRRGSAADNGGTVLKDALDRSWEREKLGADILPAWWGILPTRLGGGDISEHIDAALGVMRETGKRLLFDAGWYIHTLPIVVRSRDWIEGAGYTKTLFQKPTNTPASGLADRLAPGSGGGVDNYNVDACFILYPEDDGQYVYGVRMSGFYAESAQNSRSVYGLYAPRMCYNHFADFCFSSQYAIFTKDCWMTQWDRCMADRCTIGWWFDGTGTSNTFNSCFAHDFSFAGWNMKGMFYSNMNSCGADIGASGSNFPAFGYIFDNCQITMSGAGTDGIIGGVMKLLNGSKINTSSLYAGLFNLDAMAIPDRAAKLDEITDIFNLFDVAEGCSLVLDNADLRINGIGGKVRPYAVYGAGAVIELRGSTVLPSAGEIDATLNQWGGGLVRDQRGMAVQGWLSASTVGGVVTMNRRTQNVSVTRNSIGDYTITTAFQDPIGQMNATFQHVIFQTGSNSIRYQFISPAGKLADPDALHWVGL